MQLANHFKGINFTYKRAKMDAYSTTELNSKA